MAYLPSLRQKAARQVVTSAFGGINRAERIQDGEFAEAMNLSTREAPLLCPRKRRGTVRTLNNPQGILAKERLCWVDGSHVYYDGAAVAGLTLSTAATDCPKQLVGFGAYILIFPDQMYFSALDPTDCGSMGLDSTITCTSSRKATLAPCRVDGSDWGNITVSATEPADPANGQYWMDTGAAPHRLMVYSTAYGSWTQILTVYTRISLAGIGSGCRAGDAIEISGLTGSDQVTQLNGVQYVYDCGPDYIVVLGLLDQAVTKSSGSVRVQRRVPLMDYVTESENRLWGCRYGLNRDGATVNEIYACKLGDFRNWNVYQGISTDSYTVSVGSDGPFTGAITYGGYPMFFKENCLHKLYGAQPKNYQVMTTQMRGVQAGSSRSLCIVDGTLMYLSQAGAEAYEGALPTLVSAPLGERARSEGVGGTAGRKYYLSMLEDGARHLYVYDAANGIWLEEDAIEAVGFAEWGGDLYALDGDSGDMLALLGTAGTPEETVNWQAESGLIGWDTVEQKYVTRFNIRLALEQGARVEVRLQYDGGEWQQKAAISSDAARTRTALMPVYPRRCDHIRMRMTGSGEARVYSIARLLSGGGDGQRG